jgi:CBS domain containing-hemolysin-like protein
MSALFSGIEISVAALSPFHYQKKYKDKILFLLHNKEKIISSMLIGNNITIVGATIALDGLIPENISIYGKAGFFTLQILLFFFLAEMLPKSIFRKLNSWILIKLYYIVLLIYYLLKPFGFIFIGLTKFLLKYFPESGKREIKKEDIIYFIRNQFGREKRPITQGLSLLSSTRAFEVMTPIPEIFSINKDCSVKDALGKIKGTSYSRYPVFEDRGDNLIGYINIIDLLQAKMTNEISRFIHPAFYVPESIFIDNILYKMQEQNMPMVFIVNEYGSVTGIITIENIAEELVGTDILTREQITEKPYIVKISPTEFELDGNLDIDDFNQVFNLHVEKSGFETITGYVIKILGEIPKAGTKIPKPFGNLVIKKANEKTVLSIILELNKEL